jgi:protein TonB
VAAPPPAPVRQAPIPPPLSRPQERPATAPPPAPVREAPIPAPANRPQEHPAAPPPHPQEAKPESRDSGPHADRTSRDRAER